MSDLSLLDLDRRLTRLEQLIQTGLADIVRRLDQLNGRVADGERWQRSHEQAHTALQVEQARLEARVEQQDAAAQRAETTGRWRWGVVVALGTAAANALVQVLLRLVAR
jgi:hypothetical protein